jgi:hypothetical protein
MTEASAASMAIELYEHHRQHGEKCGGCGEPWPCPTRQAAPGHYQPRRGVYVLDEAKDVLARHTELDGHCTACGEEWMCADRQAARGVYQREGLERPVF